MEGKFMKKVFLMLMLLMPMIGLYACDTCGFLKNNEQKVFSVSGFDPYSNSKYTGIAEITNVGGVFSIRWVFPDGSSEVGTGVKIGKQLSISYATDDPSYPNPGIQVYDLITNDKLKGPWAPIGGSIIGTETLERIY
jgi:hypothetical protein